MFRSTAVRIKKKGIPGNSNTCGDVYYNVKKVVDTIATPIATYGNRSVTISCTRHILSATHQEMALFT